MVKVNGILDTNTKTKLIVLNSKYTAPIKLYSDTVVRPKMKKGDSIVITGFTEVYDGEIRIIPWNSSQIRVIPAVKIAKASDIKFVNEAGAIEHAYTTSWGVSTRLVGGIIMTHSDDNGLRLPPKVAPKHVVIIPVIPKTENTQEVLDYADKIAAMIKGITFDFFKIIVDIDERIFYRLYFCIMLNIVPNYFVV
jgi:hypothetical protein